MSVSGLHSILQRVNGVAAGRQTLRDANRIVLEACPHSEVIMVDGSPFTWEMAQPAQLLAYMVDASPGLQDVFGAAARRCPCDSEHLWDILLAFDEFTPGSKFKPKNRRKTMTVSFTIMQLGQNAISHECAWFTFLTLRSTVIADAQGGWSFLLAVLLRLMFCSPLSISKAGVPLRLGGEPFLMFGRLKVILTDGDGARLALSWRGAGSVRPCWLCRNCWKKGHTLIAGHANICCSDWDTFQVQDADTMEGQVDVLIAAHARFVAGEISKGSFDELQEFLGWNHNPTGLVAAVDLRAEFRIANIFRTDWVHNMLQDGLVNQELSAFMIAASKVGIKLADWNSYLKADWSFPRHRVVKASACMSFSPSTT